MFFQTFFNISQMISFKGISREREEN